MHKLVTYEEDTARILLRLIDSLLVLLTEIKPVRSGDVTLDAIKRMLRRAPIQRGQRSLYQALYQAGSKGLTNNELVQVIKRDRKELSGILGALGRRINNTEGMEGKGGINAIFEIQQINKLETHYRLRPIMIKALEDEKLV